MEASIEREREDTQDPGTILSIVLAAPAVVLAVKAIAAWAMRNNQPTLVLDYPGGRLVMRNMSSSDVPKAIEALKSVPG